METDLHLQISQHQARLEHENFTVSNRTVARKSSIGELYSTFVRGG